jgi:hypothetical protein
MHKGNFGWMYGSTHDGGHINGPLSPRIIGSSKDMENKWVTSTLV